jgi:hypothetical protein
MTTASVISPVTTAREGTVENVMDDLMTDFRVSLETPISSAFL